MNLLINIKENRVLILVNFALLCAQLAFGGFNVVGKYALDYTTPIIFAFYREILSGPLLLIIAAIVERVLPDKRDWWKFVILGLLMYGSQLGYIMGLKLTDSATQTAIMQQCIPVFTAAMTVALRMEQFSFLKLAGFICSIAGAVAMIGTKNLSLKDDRTLGMMCLAGQCLVLSISYIFQKPVLKKYPPITTTGWSYIVASCTMGLTSLLYVKDPAIYKLSTKVFLPLGYAIFIQTIIGYCCISWANSKVPATIIAIYTCLQPLIAFVLARIFFHEVFVWNEGVGMALVISGLILVTAARAREEKKLPKPTEEDKIEDESTVLLPPKYSVVINEGN
eukprot:Phypoly_transcript_10205.p1 GENE.Phypoly_transcript_10205~~Phypoly_transcript_10205.p1  ORF type:complete len:381 (+),score=46.23 Phypoly_transcript_10205:137-1144(+)